MAHFPVLARSMLWCLPLLLTLGCPKPHEPDAPAGNSPIEITLLYTSDEHGWILSHLHEGVRRGGVTQLLAMLTEDEDHCAGAFDGPQPDCTNSNTNSNTNSRPRPGRARGGGRDENPR